MDSSLTHSHSLVIFNVHVLALLFFLLVGDIMLSHKANFGMDFVKLVIELGSLGNDIVAAIVEV